MKSLRVEILGSGTSTGVPIPSCSCKICSSTDPKNKRLRTSIALTSEKQTVVIDTGADFRTQVLRSGIKDIAAVLYTHTHADHIFGIDDLRGFNYTSGKAIPLYADKDSIKSLKEIFSYIFTPDLNYPGGALPKLLLNEIVPFKTFEVAGLKITPLPLLHGKLVVLGFRIGNFAYLTDCSEIPEATKEKLTDLDYLIIDGLRDRPHPTHLSFARAVCEIEQLRPRKAYLTHITHEVDHDAGNARLKELTSADVELGYDGLVLEL